MVMRILVLMVCLIVVLFLVEMMFFLFSNVLFKLIVINFICRGNFFKNEVVLCSMFSFFMKYNFYKLRLNVILIIFNKKICKKGWCKLLFFLLYI